MVFPRVALYHGRSLLVQLLGLLSGDCPEGLLRFLSTQAIPVAVRNAVSVQAPRLAPLRPLR